MFTTSFIMLSLITATTKSSTQGVFFKVSENRLPPTAANVMWNGHASSVLACSQICARRGECRSASYRKEQNTCSLFSVVQLSYAVAALKQDKSSVFLEKEPLNRLQSPRARPYDLHLLRPVFIGLTLTVVPKTMRSRLTVTWKRMVEAGL